jgi:hypothetical protein
MVQFNGFPHAYRITPPTSGPVAAKPTQQAAPMFSALRHQDEVITLRHQQQASNAVIKELNSVLQSCLPYNWSVVLKQGQAKIFADEQDPTLIHIWTKGDLHAERILRELAEHNKIGDRKVAESEDDKQIVHLGKEFSIRVERHPEQRKRDAALTMLQSRLETMLDDVAAGEHAQRPNVRIERDAPLALSRLSAEDTPEAKLQAKAYYIQRELKNAAGNEISIFMTEDNPDRRGFKEINVIVPDRTMNLAANLAVATLPGATEIIPPGSETGFTGHLYNWQGHLIRVDGSHPAPTLNLTFQAEDRDIRDPIVRAVSQETGLPASRFELAPNHPNLIVYTPDPSLDAAAQHQELIACRKALKKSAVFSDYYDAYRSEIRRNRVSDVRPATLFECDGFIVDTVGNHRARLEEKLGITDKTSFRDRAKLFVRAIPYPGGELKVGLVPIEGRNEKINMLGTERREVFDAVIKGLLSETGQQYFPGIKPARSGFGLLGNLIMRRVAVFEYEGQQVMVMLQNTDQGSSPARRHGKKPPTKSAGKPEPATSEKPPSGFVDTLRQWNDRVTVRVRGGEHSRHNIQHGNQFLAHPEPRKRPQAKD